MRKFKYYLVLLIGMIPYLVHSQADTLFFGQVPPGDSAVIFAPGIITLADRKELKITFSPNGKECILGIVMDNKFQFLSYRYEKNQWSEPSVIDFPNTYFEREPVFVGDGNQLFFVAPQPLTDKHWITDIWMSSKLGNKWSTPVQLPEPVNSSYEEWHPSLTSKGVLYFCSNRENGKYYIYRAEKIDGKYKVEKLPELINSVKYSAFDPFIATDESYLIFTSGQYTDQYISYRNAEGSWTNPVNLGSKINTEGIEYGSFLTFDGKYYFFSRVERYGLSGTGDIYWVKASFID